jgi:hypothetical protein
MKSFARKLESMKAFSPHRLGLLAVIFALTLLTSKADAQTGGWFTASISLLETDSTGSINVYLSGNSQCGSSRLIYVHSITADDAKAMLASLLSWQAQGMQVSVYVQQCSGGYGTFTSAYAGISN